MQTELHQRLDLIDHHREPEESPGAQAVYLPTLKPEEFAAFH